MASNRASSGANDMDDDSKHSTDNMFNDSSVMAADESFDDDSKSKKFKKSKHDIDDSLNSSREKHKKKKKDKMIRRRIWRAKISIGSIRRQRRRSVEKKEKKLKNEKTKSLRRKIKMKRKKDPIRFLRAREVVHYQRQENLRLLTASNSNERTSTPSTPHSIKMVSKMN